MLGNRCLDRHAATRAAPKDWRGPTVTPWNNQSGALSAGEVDHLQLESVGIGHEHGIVASAVLRIVGGRVEDDGALLLHHGMGVIDVGAIGGMERQVIQPGAMVIAQPRRVRRPPAAGRPRPDPRLAGRPRA